jgi:uncharacterized protein YndB with AHSA1/START domain
MTGTDTFRTSRFLPHSPGRVFMAFSNEMVLASWWGPKGFTNEFEQFDFRSGGRWKFAMLGPDGSRHPNERVFTSVEPAKRLVIRHVSSPRFSLTVELTPVEGGTRIDWIQTFDAPAVAAALQRIVVPANEQNLDRLGAALTELESSGRDINPIVGGK